jgi:hypothetical protein
MEGTDARALVHVQIVDPGDGHLHQDLGRRRRWTISLDDGEGFRSAEAVHADCIACSRPLS